MKKKLFLVAIATMLCFSMLAGCGKKDVEDTNTELGSIDENSTQEGYHGGDKESQKDSTDTSQTSENTESGLIEVTPTDDKKVSNDTITIDICGIEFNLGDEWEPIKKQLETKGFDFTMQENLGAYHFDEKNEATFYYRTGEIDGKNVIKLIRYSLPEPYIIDKDFQENMVKFNGYTVTETEEFAIAHNLGENYKDQNIETDNNIILIGGKSITISIK